jgi:hypothetical protein
LPNSMQTPTSSGATPTTESVATGARSAGSPRTKGGVELGAATFSHTAVGPRRAHGRRRPRAQTLDR